MLVIRGRELFPPLLASAGSLARVFSPRVTCERRKECFDVLGSS